MQSKLLLAALLGFAGTVAAQTSATPDVAIYRSAFDGYRAWQPQPALDWRRANDQMQQLGGHTGHLGTARDKSAVDQTTRAPAAPAPSAAAGKPASAPGAHSTERNNKR